MKILHILSGMGAKDGGTSSCSYVLLKALRKEQFDAEVLCYEPVAGDVLVGNEDFIKTVSYPRRNKFLYSKNYKKALIKTKNISLYHINGLWEYPSMLTAIVARKTGVPYLISPHGMLYPQALSRSKWLKKIVYTFFLKKDLQKATVIHATCIEEMQHLRNMGVETPIAVIPNAIDLDTLLENPIQTKTIKKFGYLGRVHPRKKIETLLYVWAKLGSKVNDSELVIIGSGDDGYMTFLEQEVQRLHLKNVVFTGFLTGNAKEKIVENLSYLAVPSDFENFGMIVVEALAVGIPVIASKGTPWKELETDNCGWWIENSINSFCAIFEKALHLSEPERLVMAENGRKLILEKYNSQIVAQKMVQLYDWVLNKGVKPDFVYLKGGKSENSFEVSTYTLPPDFKDIKITHCISSIDKSTGGPARSVVHLAEALGDLDVFSEVNLLTIESKDCLVSQFLNVKLHLEFYTRGLFKYSSGLKDRLNSIPTELFHAHGIWELPVHQMAKIARKRKLPYVISTRGMLEPWSLTQRKFKKKLAMLLFQYNDLKKAACLHATGLMEVESIKNRGFKNPIANIPNGIDINHYPEKQYVTGKNEKTILFLSRIHPKKGIEILINVWQLLDTDLKENWCVKIAGNGEENYINQLNVLIKEKGLAENITIIGPKFGREKIAVYHEADIFVLPSYSENFGMVIAEALCCGLPVITTKGTPWQELEIVNAGKWIAIGEDSLKEALVSFMGKTDEELHEMGKNGRKLIVEKYSIESVARKFVLLYQWILTGKNKPEFIYLYMMSAGVGLSRYENASVVNNEMQLFYSILNLF